MKNIENLFQEVKKTKINFIVVTGGVCSSIGKGVLISSIGVLLKNSGYSVTVIKWDPYLNVDPGTMSPLVHGEVFVTQDGAETDLDLGHYERMLDLTLNRASSVSSGQIFQEILEHERKGLFLGADIQLVPHVVEAIIRRLLNFALTEKMDFVLIEVGGTVGDIEAEIFLEAIHQIRYYLGNERMMHCHLSYVPYLAWVDELKTKPTQHSVMALKKTGIKPDSLFLRLDNKVGQEHIKKLSIRLGIPENMIFQVPTCKPTYSLFMELQSQDLDCVLQNYFGQQNPERASLHQWQNLVTNIKKEKSSITIGLVAKYIGGNDPYMSVIEAIKAAAWHCLHEVNIEIISGEKIEQKNKDELDALHACDGLIIPGGFGKRGVEGKIQAITWAREQGVPTLGICLGMQTMIIEFARSLAGLNDASSSEFDPKTSNPVIDLLDEQKEVVQCGGTMRLGSYPCTIKEGTLAFKAYGKKHIYERHRHRYEFNNRYRELFEKIGVAFSGIFEQKNLVEIVELKNHPFMVGCQFHPEFLSRPLKPHPLFVAFIEAAIQAIGSRYFNKKSVYISKKYQLE
jgi:CTP synthase